MCSAPSPHDETRCLVFVNLWHAQGPAGVVARCWTAVPMKRYFVHMTQRQIGVWDPPVAAAMACPCFMPRLSKLCLDFLICNIFIVDAAESNNCLRNTRSYLRKRLRLRKHIFFELISANSSTELPNLLQLLWKSSTTTQSLLQPYAYCIAYHLLNRMNASTCTDRHGPRWPTCFGTHHSLRIAFRGGDPICAQQPSASPQHFGLQFLGGVINMIWFDHGK